MSRVPNIQFFGVGGMFNETYVSHSWKVQLEGRTSATSMCLHPCKHAGWPEQVAMMYLLRLAACADYQEQQEAQEAEQQRQQQEEGGRRRRQQQQARVVSLRGSAWMRLSMSR